MEAVTTVVEESDLRVNIAREFHRTFRWLFSNAHLRNECRTLSFSSHLRVSLCTLQETSDVEDAFVAQEFVSWLVHYGYVRRRAQVNPQNADMRECVCWGGGAANRPQCVMF